MKKNNNNYYILEKLLSEIKEEYAFEKKYNNESLNPIGCENCSGHFGYNPEEGYLYDCSDCNKHNNLQKEKIEKLENYIKVLSEILGGNDNA